MKRLLFLFIPFLLGMTACNQMTSEQAEKSVMQGEIDRLPLLLQSIPFVDDITIDSIRLNVTAEPMQGYLYTTWKSGVNETSIIVPVSNIHSSKENKGYIEWQSDWESAAKAYLMKRLSF